MPTQPHTVTAEGIAQLRRLRAAATPGPWRFTPSERPTISTVENDGYHGYMGNGFIAEIGKYGPDWGQSTSNLDDAALIVATINSLPALLNEIEALRAGLSRALEAVVSAQPQDMIDEAADEAATDFITTKTDFPLDGRAHRALVRAFRGFHRTRPTEQPR